jgi:hypothetical protein
LVWKLPSTLPAGEYLHTTRLPRGQPVPPRPLLQDWTAQPMVLLLRQTTCVKWPVAELKPGLLKLYIWTSSYLQMQGNDHTEARY